MSNLLGQVERELSVAHGDAQLILHHLHGGVVGQLEVVDACHHRGQIVLRVRVDAARVYGLAHDGERRLQRSEAADGQARAAGDELQELTLLVRVERAHDLEEELDGTTLVRVAVVAARGRGQLLGVPRVVRRAAEELLQL